MAQPQETRPPHEHFAAALRKARGSMTQVQLMERTIELGDPIKQGLISQYESGWCGISDGRTATLTRVLDCGSVLWDARREDADGTTGADNGCFQAGLAA